jgi:FecR protein
MKATHHNEPPARRLVRPSTALSLALCALGAAPAFAIDSGDIAIANLKGEVHFVIGGAVRVLRDGAVLEPPATLRTGHDGSVDLRQGATTVSVGPDTVLEFPALEKRGAPIDRIVQPSGSAFYDIGKRAGRKLRVETPYLVGVVKGTQFNVVAQQHGATISLYEGLLEIRAADDSSAVDIRAGEVASRKDGDRAIGVTTMNDPAPRPARPSPAPATGGQLSLPTIEGDARLAGAIPPEQPVVSDLVETFLEVKPAAPLVPGASPNVIVEGPASGAGVPPAVDTAVEVDPGPVVAGTPGGNVDVGVTVGGADLGVGTEQSPGENDDHPGNNGNGNAGSKSAGNGTGNSGNGDDSNHGHEDDGVHGLAHKK